MSLDALIVIGGDGTLKVAHRLSELGVPVVGVPKTIDNDLEATDTTFGFDTAVQVATDALDRLHTTAESHRRVFVVEVMGRHTGWIALHAGLAGGADVILVPERRTEIEDVCARIHRRVAAGRRFSVLVVAEGVELEDGVVGAPSELNPAAVYGGIAHRLAHELEARTGMETRAVVLGHLQRGGTPSAFDRLLATRLGVAALDAVSTRSFGRMAALRGNRIQLVPLREAIGRPRRLTEESLHTVDAILGRAEGDAAAEGDGATATAALSASTGPSEVRCGAT